MCRRLSAPANEDHLQALTPIATTARPKRPGVLGASMLAAVLKNADSRRPGAPTPYLVDRKLNRSHQPKFGKSTQASDSSVPAVRPYLQVCTIIT